MAVQGRNNPRTNRVSTNPTAPLKLKTMSMQKPKRFLVEKKTRKRIQNPSGR